MAGVERYVMRLVGGPTPGTWLVSASAYPWPTPDRLTVPLDETGAYFRVSESTLDPLPPDLRLVRGAAYEWRSTT